MLQKFIVILLLSIYLSECTIKANDRHDVRKFPDGFLFGTSTASYQIEGSWNVDGKSENIWDYLTHNNPELIKDKSNGDIANDSYNKYKRDVEMMRELGLDFYRFSLSWTRILPTSFPDQINKAGIEYYNNVIDEMLKYNIQPVVTLYHWDMPQKLQEMGGWTNPHIVDWYVDYVRVAFEAFGDRVKNWLTINEPHEICSYGYGQGRFAPRLNFSGFADYLCTKYVLLAHAKAYRLYDEVYRPVQKGNISISIHAPWYEPRTEADTQIALEAMEFVLGQYANPIFSETGDFPQVMKDRIAAKSAVQGFQRSRLPEFTAEEIEMLRGSSDFFGLNHYPTYLVSSGIDMDYEVPSYSDDGEFELYQPSDWNKVTPWGFHRLLVYIRDVYGNPPLIVTENGKATQAGLVDEDRVIYYRGYLGAVLDAIDDGCNIIGYTAWSLMDNFEWLQGYTERYGLYEVDYDSPERTRTPRKSAFIYKEVLRTRSLDVHYEPDMTVLAIDEGH